jgi:hypothetical protein
MKVLTPEETVEHTAPFAMTNEEKLVAINAYLKLKGRKTYYEIGPCRESIGPCKEGNSTSHEGLYPYRTATTTTRFRRLINPCWLSQVSVKRAIEHILSLWR